LSSRLPPGSPKIWKWDPPVRSHNGPVGAAAGFKDHVKLNFFKGASVKDPKRHFNAGHDAKATRAIDFLQADTLDAPALKELVRAAVALNASSGKKKEPACAVRRRTTT